MGVAEIYRQPDYGPSPEGREAAETWLEARGRSFGLFIGGAFGPARSRERFATQEPASGRRLAELAQAGAEDVDAAVAAARTAQPRWAALSGHVRARHLYALARVIQRHARLLAVVETLDNGKPIRESRDIDVPLAARHFYHHAGWAQLLEEEFPRYRPLGVAGQVIPWNFPLLMLAWKVAPALAAGCTVVLKPAENTSLSALLFAELCQEVGLPGGVLNIVTGDGRSGELLVRHPDVDKLAFTGSTEVGRLIREATAGSGKRLTLELGGKSPFLVFEDADLDAAVEGLVDAIWLNQGQVCCAGSRLLIQESVAGRFLEKLKMRMSKLRVGDPLDKSTDIGALISAKQRERVERLVRQGVAEGAVLWQPDIPCPGDGCYYLPSLLTEVAPASTVAQEEIFGPVLAAMTFRTPSEAVALANNSRYGLAASLWSENISLALDLAPRLVAGTVWINASNQFDAACGFGGCRESGFGREGGREGLYEYLAPTFEAKLPPVAPPPAVSAAPMLVASPPVTTSHPPVDRTAKLYIGGRQQRPDGGYSRPVLDPRGRLLAEVAEGNRKDIRDAVEAARKAASWSSASGPVRAQVLFYIAENLAARGDEFAGRLRSMTGVAGRAARREVEAAVARLFSYAAWADKFEGAVHAPPLRGVTLAMQEPLGLLGIVCGDDAPLLALVSLIAPAIAVGNRVVVVPSEAHPLAATDFYQVLDTSDLPGGVVNIVTGASQALAEALAAHDALAALWYAGPAAGAAAVERAAAGNLKRTWTFSSRRRDWFDVQQGEGREFLRQATQVKNIWIPYGD